MQHLPTCCTCVGVDVSAGWLFHLQYIQETELPRIFLIVSKNFIFHYWQQSIYVCYVPFVFPTFSSTSLRNGSRMESLWLTGRWLAQMVAPVPSWVFVPPLSHIDRALTWRSMCPAVSADADIWPAGGKRSNFSHTAAGVWAFVPHVSQRSFLSR